MSLVDIDPQHLIALARWIRYDETPDEPTRRELARHSVTPIHVAFGSDARILGAVVADVELGTELRNIPSLNEWIRKSFPPREAGQPHPLGNPATDPTATRALAYVVEPGEAQNDFRQRLVVITGTTPTENGWTLDTVRDAEPLAYPLEFAS